jgi:hypothetical protein
LFTGFAAFGFVFQTLVVEENLFARSPDEILVAVNALDGPILVFTFRVCFQCVGRFRL